MTTGTFSVATTESFEVVDVTEQAIASLGELPEANGLALFSLDHTTAALVVGADDPELRRDFARVAEALVAPARPFEHLQHDMANGEAHILSALGGVQVVRPIVAGRLVLGKWQRLLVLEFDGPQQRTIDTHVVLTGGAR